MRWCSFLEQETGGVGERVGELLQQLEAAQLRKEVTTRAEAREFLKRMAK